MYQPLQGVYQFLVTGTALGTYDIDLSVTYKDGSVNVPISMNGIASRGSTATYQVNLNTSPGGSTQVVRIASFSVALADVNNSFLLGFVGNRTMANSLSKRIEAAQNAAQPARNNILNAFKNEVTAQSGRQITGAASQVLLEDADYLLRQNP